MFNRGSKTARLGVPIYVALRMKPEFGGDRENATVCKAWGAGSC